MKKKLVTLFSTLSMAVILTVSVMASSYTSSLYFQGEYAGPVHQFKGSSIYYQATTYPDGTNRTADTYTVSLYRKHVVYADYIGKKEFKRKGTGSTTFTNVGDGNYYFYFTKARDGINVIADKGQVIMKV